MPSLACRLKGVSKAYTHKTRAHLAYSVVVNISSEGQGDRGGTETLLKQTAELARGVDLSPEGGHPEVVLGTEGGDALLGKTTHHALRRSNRKGHINTSLDSIGKLLPEGSVESTLSLELSASNPVIGLVAGEVGDGGIGTLSEALTLPDSLETEAESGSDGLEVVANEDTGETAVEEGGVDGLEGGSKVVALVLVLELGHILAAADRELGLGDGPVAPSVVESCRESALVVEVTLSEDLVGSVESSKGIRVQPLANSKLVGNLEA